VVDHPARQIDAVDDIAPLIRSAHLHKAAVAAVQFKEIIGLQDHVVEFEERQRLLAVQPRFHALKRQHAVDAEMPANVAQEAKVVQIIQPFGIVDHHRIGRPVAKADIGRKRPLDPGDIVINLRVGQQRPLIGAKARIAHLGRAAAHQHDRLAPRFLQPAQHHDLDQRAYMQRLRRRIKADIARHDPLDQSLVKRLIIRAIGEKAAGHHHAHEIRFRVVGHGTLML